MLDFKKNKCIDIIACGALYIEEELEITENTLVFGREYIIQKRRRKTCGSVVNFSLECAKNDLSTSIIGCIGNDKLGKKVLRDLERNKIGTQYLQVNSKQKTGNALCILNDKKETVMITDIGANKYLDIDQFLATQNINVKILYLGGMFKMKSLFMSYIKLVIRAKKNNVMVAVDHGRFFAEVTDNQISVLNNLLIISDFYFPNKREILQFTNTETLEAATGNIIRSFPNLTVAIKLGQEGCRIIKNGKFFNEPAVPCSEIISTGGAGDVFNAGFLMKYTIENSSLEEAAKFANQVAAKRICTINQNSFGI